MPSLSPNPWCASWRDDRAMDQLGPRAVLCAHGDRAPASEAELVEVVARAAQRGERVRAVATGHSFTDCACTDGVMIDTTGLQRVSDADPVSGLVTIKGGAKLHELGPQPANLEKLST